MTANNTQTERRQHERVLTQLEGEFAIVVPEETFTPTVRPCVVLDVSPGGCRVRCANLPRAEYHQLIRGTRYVKLLIRFGTDPSSHVEVRGTVCWVDFHQDSRGILPTYCEVGIAVRTPSEAFLREVNGIANGKLLLRGVPLP